MVYSLQFAPKFGLAVFIATALGHVGHAGTLRRIWDFDTRAVTGFEVRSLPLSVFSLRFSRDGQRIAVTVGRSWRDQAIVILDTRLPETHYAKIAIHPQIGEGTRIEWSPSGKQINLGQTIVQLSNGLACDLPGHSQFVSATEVVSYEVNLHGFSFFDLESLLSKLAATVPLRR